MIMFILKKAESCIQVGCSFSFEKPLLIVASWAFSSFFVLCCVYICPVMSDVVHAIVLSPLLFAIY